MYILYANIGRKTLVKGKNTNTYKKYTEGIEAILYFVR